MRRRWLWLSIGLGVVAIGGGVLWTREARHYCTRSWIGPSERSARAPSDEELDRAKREIGANGHVHDGRPQFPFAMPAQLLIGGTGGRLSDVSAKAGPPFQVPRLGRGLAAGDLDNDGRVDALLLGQNEPLAYFRNQTEVGGHSVTLDLEGCRSSRDAIGARVTLAAGGHRQVTQRLGGGSYQSASDPRLHFGLGDARRVDWLEVRWPSGTVDRHVGLDADTGYRLREGDRVARPSRGWKRPAGRSRDVVPSPGTSAEPGAAS